MSKRLSFSLKIHKRSTHWVSVQLYQTRSAMRGVLRKLGHDSSETNAACWQPNKAPVEDGCIAEVHFNRETLGLDTIAHEMCHAAYHRAVIIGIPIADKTFQEYVAEDTGTLTDACVAFLDSKGVRIGCATVKKRRVTTTR